MKSKSDISLMFSTACNRIHVLATELYESMHDDNGDPIADIETASKFISEFRQALNIEIDLIKESIRQFNEQK